MDEKSIEKQQDEKLKAERKDQKSDKRKRVYKAHDEKLENIQQENLKFDRKKRKLEE